MRFVHSPHGVTVIEVNTTVAGHRRRLGWTRYQQNNIEKP